MSRKEEPTTTNNNKDLHVEPRPTTDLEDDITESPPPILEKYIGKEPIITDDQTRSGQEIELGDSGEIIFDQEALMKQMLEQIDIMIAAIDGKNSMSWYFEDDNEPALQVIRQSLLETKSQLQQAIEIGNFSLEILGDRLQGSYGQMVQERIQLAREMLKVSSQKELIRRMVEVQSQLIPIDTITTTNGTEIRFNLSDAFEDEEIHGDESESLEWLYTTNPHERDVQKHQITELIISSKYGIDILKLEGEYDPNTQTITVLGKFSGKIIDINDDEFVIEIAKGQSNTQPVFQRIRVIRKPFSMRDELIKYQQKEELQRQQYNSRPPTASQPQRYAPRVPSPTATSSG